MNPMNPCESCAGYPVNSLLWCVLSLRGVQPWPLAHASLRGEKISSILSLGTSPRCRPRPPIPRPASRGHDVYITLLYVPRTYLLCEDLTHLLGNTTRVYARIPITITLRVRTQPDYRCGIAIVKCKLRNSEEPQLHGRGLHPQSSVMPPHPLASVPSVVHVGPGCRVLPFNYPGTLHCVYLLRTHDGQRTYTLRVHEPCAVQTAHAAQRLASWRRPPHARPHVVHRSVRARLPFHGGGQAL